MSSSFIKRGTSTRRSEDTLDDDNDDKDDTKRKSRNLSEKKRRDQFNMLINELSSMVSATSRKMDKSTVLKSTISFIKNHNEIAVRSRAHEIQEEWKPSFLSNEEFTHLILEALDGFIMVFSCAGRIFYASESITSLLGHLPNDLLNSTIYDMAYENDQSELYNMLLHPNNPVDASHYTIGRENQITFYCHMKRGGLDFGDDPAYELVQFVGYFRSDIDAAEVDPMISSSNSFAEEANNRIVFVGTGRLQTPQLIREMSIVDSSKSEFTSRHSLEWKFLFLDHRAPPIIGYLPFEVLGTSGYDYYHIDDLEKVVSCHEALMQKGEGTSCYYRFLTKGQQWIWLQTRFYITYHQWNSKPEFIVCTHSVVSYIDVMRRQRESPSKMDKLGDDVEGLDNEGVQNDSLDMDRDMEQEDEEEQGTDSHLSAAITQSGLPASWSPSKSSVGRSSRFGVRSTDGSPSQLARGPPSKLCGPGSDCNSMSGDSPAFRQSRVSVQSGRSGREDSASSHSLQQHQPAPLHQHQHSLQPRTVSTVIATTYPHYQPPTLQPTSPLQHQQPQQFVTAIPVQSTMITTPTVISTMAPPESALQLLRQPLVVTAPQQGHLQDQLQRKHAELQQMIVQQQEELRRVSEQLLMARYGLMPINVGQVSVAYPPTGAPSSSTASLNTSTELLYAQSRMAPPVYATGQENPMHDQIMGGRTDETIPFQLSQQQAQLLFTSGIGIPPNQPPSK